MATPLNSNRILQKNYFFTQWLYHYTPEQIELIRNSNLVERLKTFNMATNVARDTDVIIDLLNLLHGTNHTSVYVKYDTFEDCFNNDFTFNFSPLDILYAYSLIASTVSNSTIDYYCPNKTTLIYRMFHIFMNARTPPRILFSLLFKDVVFARHTETSSEPDYIHFIGGNGFEMARDYGTQVAGKQIWDFSVAQGRITSE